VDVCLEVGFEVELVVLLLVDLLGSLVLDEGLVFEDVGFIIC
jgi:hypothetical protein